MAFTEQSLGNLLYYPDYPKNLIFFDTLSDKDGYNKSRGTDYYTQSKRIYKEGINYLAHNLSVTNSWLDKGSDEYTKKINEIIIFLQKAIEQEKNNELNYFKQKKDLILRQFTQEEINADSKLKQLVQFLQMSVNNVQDFDYQTFIILINSLLQGREFTKQSITYEKQRLHSVKDATVEATRALSEQMQAENKVEQISENKQRRYYYAAARKLKNYYIEHKTISGQKGLVSSEKILTSIPPTIDVHFAKFIRQCINNAWNDKNTRNEFLTVIKNYCVNHPNSAPNNINIQELKNILTRSVLNYAGQHMDKIISPLFSSTTTDKIMQDVMDQIQNDILSLQMQVENVPQNLFWTSEIPFFEKGAQQYKTSKDLFKIINKFYLQAHKSGIKELSSSQKSVYQELGLSGRGNDSNKRTKAMIDFINSLENFTESLHRQAKKNSKETKEEANKIIKNFKGSDNETHTFTFTFDKKGRLIMPKDFLEYYAKESYGVDTLFNINSTKAKTLETFLAMAKSKASQFLRDKLITIKNDQTKHQILNVIEKQLKRVEMSISGPAISELLAGLQIQFRGEEMLLYFPGYENNKNDFITMSVEFDEQYLSLQLKDIFSSILTLNCDKISKEIVSERKKAALEFQEYFSSKMSELKKKSTDASGFHNYQEKARIFFEASKQYRENFNKSVKQLDQLYKQSLQLLSNNNNSQGIQNLKQRYTKLQQLLKHSFYRSDTMKTYNEYQNDIGFIGGSIGTNLTQQLESIAQMFQQAGLDMTDDLDLLTNIIANTSPETIIHERFHRTIETYLGSVAAFMLFDEGGAEAEILHDTIKGQSTHTQSPDILHLYRLNGIYFPGSFILSQTLKGVQQLNKTLLEIKTLNKGPVIRHGATISILNKMNTSDIPKVGSSETPWEDVYQTAINDNVQLHITFMAGFINILHNLQQRMNNITLPKV